MRVIEPIAVTESLLTSSTVAEPDTATGETAYSSMTSYDTGELAVLDHLLYRSLIDSNVDNSPDASPDEWLLLGPSNQFKPFNYLSNARSTGASPYVIEVTPAQRIGAVVVRGLIAASAQLRVVRPGDVVVYDQTIDLITRATTGWYSYWFGDFEFQDVALFLDIPPVPDGVFELTLTGSGNVSLSDFVLGQQTIIGHTEYRASDDALDFSRITRDALGNATLTPGRVVPLLMPPIVTAKDLVPAVRRLRGRTGGVPTVFIGVDDPADPYFPSHFAFGKWSRFKIEATGPSFARIDLSVENL